jgi:hypothetical protein
VAWQHRTRMRPPVVKRQTPLKSGLCQFFPLWFRLSVVRLWPRVPSSLPWAGAPTRRHHTRMEVHSPQLRRVQRRLSVVSATEKLLGTRVPSSTKRRLNGRRSRVRLRLGGGAAHVHPTRPSRSGAEPERMSNQRAGLRGNGLCAPQRSRRSAIGTTAHALQAPPAIGPFGTGLLRSAPDALWRKCGISKALSRVNIWETARASLSARTVKALPVPCFFSRRTSNFGSVPQLP